MDRRSSSNHSGENLFTRLFAPERGRRTAIKCEGREITYGELREFTVKTAEALKAFGIVEGDRVALLLDDSPEFIASFVAIISVGTIAVPINMALRQHDQIFILNDCGAVAAIAEGRVINELFRDHASVPEIETLLVVRGEIPDIEGISSSNIQSAWSELDRNFPAAAHTDKDAFILYTSGSTGEPKGAVHTQADIFYTNDIYCREVLDLREGDRLFSSSRLPFAYGLGNAFTFPLLNGCTTILCREKPTPEVISHVFSEYLPTIFFGVPVVYRMLLEHHRNVAPLDTSSLRLCVSAGEALPAQLGQEWQDTFGVQVLDGIGSTEMLHMWMSNHDGDVRYGSSGKLLKGYEARLIDHEERPVAAGDVGNLWIRGGSAASRYWQRPEISANTFVDGWTRTGDLYRQDADGFWWHMGRSDDCFKPTGQWVSPVEVEGVLLNSEHIRAAAVVEGFDKHELSCVCAFVVPATKDENAETIERSLIDLCAGALPRFKQPRRYIFIDELPYTATGKVQRFKLREQLRSSEFNL